MSIDMTTLIEQDFPAPDPSGVKSKTNRRHGACEPCKKSKTRCDGGQPCGACRAEKRKSRPCEYSEKAKNIAAAREEGFRRQRDADSSSPDEYYKEEPAIPQPQSSTSSGPASGPSSNPLASMHRKISLCAIVEEFIQVRPQSRPRVVQNIKLVEEEWLKFQARLANPTYHAESMSKPAVSQIESWQRELQRIKEQLKRADLKGAWSSIAALLRQFSSWETFTPSTPHVGEGISADPYPSSPSFIQERNNIYTQLVILDCELGFFLGDQSLKHDFDGSRFTMKSELDGHSEETIGLFTTIRDILQIDMSSEAGVWEFLRLRKHHSKSMPPTPLQRMTYCITDKHPAELQAIRLTSSLVHAVMHCRTASVGMHYSQPGCIVPKPADGSIDIVRELDLNICKTTSTECNLVKKHAGSAMLAFGKLCELDADNTANSWIRLHSALIATVLFGIHCLRTRKDEGWPEHHKEIKKVEQKFIELKRLSDTPECPIFEHAARILRSFDKKDLKTKRAGKRKLKQVITKPDRSSSSSSDSDEYPDPRVSFQRSQKRELTSTDESGSPGRVKRVRTMPPQKNPAVHIWEPSAQASTQNPTQSQQTSFQNQIHPTEHPIAEREPPSNVNSSFYDVPRTHSEAGYLPQQPVQHFHNTVYSTPYAQDFHAPLNPDYDWSQEHYILNEHMKLIPVDQHQQYMSAPGSYHPGLSQQDNTQFNNAFHNSNVAPLPQFVEAANPQQPTMDGTYHLSHDVHQRQGAHENENLQQVLSSPPGVPIPSWPNMQQHPASTTVSPTSYHTQMSQMPQAGLVPQPSLARRSSEPVWQMNNQYNYPAQGYPYSNPEPSQPHHARFYDSRQHQHYQAFENIDPNQYQQHYRQHYPDNGVTTPI